jgi:hypothetical protein
VTDCVQLIVHRAECPLFKSRHEGPITPCPLTPDSGHQSDMAQCPLCAISGLRAASLNHLVGERQYVGGHREAECLGRLEVDEERETCRLQHRQFARIGTAENAASVNSRLPITVTPPPQATVRSRTRSMAMPAAAPVQRAATPLRRSKS